MLYNTYQKGNFSLLLKGGRGSEAFKNFPYFLFPTCLGGGGVKAGKESFPPYELFRSEGSQDSALSVPLIVKIMASMYTANTV